MLMELKISCLRNKKGFTLAEVLITLGIIGVVATFTIPVLMNSIQDAQFKTAYKKAFSVASQAWMSAAGNNEMVYRPSYGDAGSRTTNFTTFKTYFKIAKDCNNSNNSECWASGDIYAQYYPTADALSFIDASGMAWSILSSTWNCSSGILVDTNGLKGPNKFGQDRFPLTPMASDGNSATGIPVKLMPENDVPSYEQNYCPSGDQHPCWNKKWLYN